MWAAAEALLPKSLTPKGIQVRVLGAQLAVGKEQAEEVASYYQSMEYGLLKVKAGVSCLLDEEIETYIKLAKPDSPEPKHVRLITLVFTLPSSDVIEAARYYENMEYGLLPVNTCERRLLESEREEFKQTHGLKHGYDLIN